MTTAPEQYPDVKISASLSASSTFVAIIPSLHMSQNWPGQKLYQDNNNIATIKQFMNHLTVALVYDNIHINTDKR